MALSTKNIKISEGKINKAIAPGNTQGMIYDISLKPGYNPDSYYLVLNIETAPIDDFEGLSKRTNTCKNGVKFDGVFGNI